MITLLDKFRSLTLCVLLLLTACSSVQTGQQSSSTLSDPSANLATVYFYRPPNSAGTAVGVDIKDNGIDIGTLQDGNYLEAGIIPSQHLFQPSLSVVFDLQGQVAIQNLQRLRYYE
jgi:hypothetical protein